jgi:RNA polymerase sigma-70 factor, ECF subfamily
MDDLELVQKLKNGDEGAFRLVVEKYQKLVLNCSFKFLRSKESAEDLTQEVFLEVFESIGSFRGNARLSTWIYRIAVTKSLNRIKHLKRKKRFAMLVSLFDHEETEERLAAPEHIGPHHQLENRERADILHQALSKLPDNQRVAFTLSKYDEMSYEEIAMIMDTTVPSVESLIHRAKTNLKKLLMHYYERQS